MPRMTLTVNLQNEHFPNAPSAADFERWVAGALAKAKPNTNIELTIRLVDQSESQQLNHDFRGKDKPTNVLSFPYEPEDEEDANYLGDLAICVAVVELEAEQQDKEVISHFCHMTIHGTLHLLGYDHIEDQDADVMEQLETELMLDFGFTDPY